MTIFCILRQPLDGRRLRQIWPICLALCCACLALCPRPAQAAQPVTMTDNGTTVTLSNGLITFTVQKLDGKVKSVYIPSMPTTNILDTGGYGMSLSLTHIGSGTDDYWTSVAGGGTQVFSVVSQSPQMIDVMIRNQTATGDIIKYPNGIWDWSVHHVLRAGDSGFYTYHVFHHTANQPAAYFVADGWGGRGNYNLFSASPTNQAWDFSGLEKMGPSFGADPPGTTYANGETEIMPLVSYYTQPTGAIDSHGWNVFTYPVGLTSQGFPTWTKYDWSAYLGPSNTYRTVWGMANDQVGLWHILASVEHMNGGPTKQKGAVSGDYMYMDDVEGHGLGTFDNPGVAAGQEFSKIIGPFFTYVNIGTGHMALWQDAQNRGQQEIASWPYAWVNESESTYPRQRGTVTGTVTTLTRQGGASAMVILSPPPSDGWTGPDGTWTGGGPNWPGESAWMYSGALGYQFWTTADASGHFTIPKVRPGSYTLYIDVPGVFGEYKQANVVVAANQTLDLGTISWDPPRRQQLLWQVGTPDHSTQEFRFGDQFQQFGLWWRYMEERGTADLNYTIGQSSPATDWYYAQSLVAVDGGTYFAPRWNINFTLASAPTAPLTFTMNIAGGYGTYFYTYVNGVNVTPAPNNYAGWPTTTGADIYRDVVKVGRWQHFELSLPASAFKLGANTLAITIRQPGFSGKWTGTAKPEMLAGGLMYDALKLEAGPLVATIAGIVKVPNWVGTPQPLVFTLTPTGTTTGSVLTQTIIPAADGSFSLLNVPVGTYTLGIKGSQWLKKDLSVSTVAGAVTGLSATLLAGDLNGDNQVSGTDIAILRAAYGSFPGVANWNPLADMNGDGTVSATDLAMMRANYGRLGDP